MTSFSNHVEITQALIDEHGLSSEEYERMLEVLGRTPTVTELGIFSAMWSEHCSYKSSRIHLAKLPTEGSAVLQGPGENAGIVDLGDGWAAAFKMESHNHPSFIEPYQGAATGVGGIMRDVFTMGARPVANLNSLRFGRAAHPRTPYLVRGVVSGIADYGNCMGVPTVGGEVTFDASYDGNILVNAFNLGLLKADRIFRGYATGIGNPVMYVGAKTGRDGIHGATMASDSFDETAEAKRPTVQKGDPFREKLLLEACLEAFQTDAIVGIQDMGAAGLTSSSFEMADRAGTGLMLDLDAIPQRAANMNPYEMMLSESQERMLLVAHDGKEDELISIFEKWDLDAVVVGRVTDTGRVVVTWQGETVADVPVEPIGRLAPKYDRPTQVPADLSSRQALDIEQIADLVDVNDANTLLLDMLGSEHLCSRRWVYQQYDHMVRLGTVVRPGDGDAAVIRLPESSRGVAMSADCNPRWCYLDPYRGAAHAVVEACRNLACVGALPVGSTDCLNFGDPTRPEIMWEFVQAIEGMAEACREMEAPIVSGNVSLYNQTGDTAIKPTPSIAVVGTVADVRKTARAVFGQPGLEVALLGRLEAAEGASLAGSIRVAMHDGLCKGRPAAVDYPRERAVQGACRALIAAGLVQVAHDTSEGGLAVALAEMCLGGVGWNRVGVHVEVQPAARVDQLLFGEDGGRIIVAYAPEDAAQIASIAAQHECPITLLGATGGDHMTMRTPSDAPLIDVAIEALHERWSTGFESAISS